MKKTWKSGCLAAVFCILIFSVGGCAWSIGEHKEHGQPTRGQELLDLKRARDAGAINENEYQVQKRRLLGQ